MRKVTSWKVCRKARPSLEQMALARSRYWVSSSLLKEPLLRGKGHTSAWLASRHVQDLCCFGRFRSQGLLPLSRRWVKPMAGKGEVAGQPLKVLLRDGASAFWVVVLEHGLERNRDSKPRTRSSGSGPVALPLPHLPPGIPPPPPLTATSFSTCWPRVLLSGFGVTLLAHSTTRGAL